jgi:hypothetical protein
VPLSMGCIICIKVPSLLWPFMNKLGYRIIDYRSETMSTIPEAQLVTLCNSPLSPFFKPADCCIYGLASSRCCSYSTTLQFLRPLTSVH